MGFTIVLSSPINHPQLRRRHHGSSSFLISSASSDTARVLNLQNTEDAKEKIRKMFEKVEISVSAYDTAWVAMSPSPSSPNTPCFPGCLDWIQQNQLDDGSWGLPHRDSSLVKDALSSTLACVLALKTWGVGEKQMKRGIDFIKSNFASAMDEEHVSPPIGFDVIFPSMIQEAIKMDLDFRLILTDIDAVLRRKDIFLKRLNQKPSKARNFHLAYISEGMGKSQDWKMAMSYQRMNGSLFNSPSATAAAFSHIQDSNCYSYLCSVLQQFGNAVPTMFPIDVYSHLDLVDTLQKLGIDRYFKDDIRNVLNETFGHWEQGHEDIFSDPCTYTIALRLLRDHGYDVSSETLAIYHEEECCFDRFGGHLEDIRSALELLRASELVIYPHESYLDKYVSQTRNFLERRISDSPMQADRFWRCMIKEVADTLKSPYRASLERLASRNHIEDYNLDDRRTLKTSFRRTNLCNEALSQLAVDDYNYCQSIHLQEFKELQRWEAENKLNQLSFCRQKLGYCYFTAAAIIFSPELADARVLWAKNAVLTTVIDDFFDVGSSEDEQLNLIELVEKWDANQSIESCSDNVGIIFSTLRDTISEIGKKAYARQNRNITGHVVEIWLSLIKSMAREAEMTRNKSVPTVEEYMANAYVSIAMGPIVLPSLYFFGHKLSEEVIRSDDYCNLFEMMSTCGRLLNDVQGYQREEEEGKLNSVTLHHLHSGGTINKEEAIRIIKGIIDDKRRELLRLVQQGNDSVVPRECREVFWKMCKVLHHFYFKDDGFTSLEMETTVETLLYHPIESKTTFIPFSGPR